jgi:hypothetical protein
MRLDRAILAAFVRQCARHANTATPGLSPDAPSLGGLNTGCPQGLMAEWDQAEDRQNRQAE